MNWFNGKRISNKNVSLLGTIVAVFAFSFTLYVANTPKHTVTKKQLNQRVLSIKKKSKQSIQSVAQKSAVKFPTKKQKIEKQKVVIKTAVKKNLKARPRIVAYVGAVKLRGNVDLSMDGWNNQHEQIETSIDKINEDPVGASAFESKRLQEELAAAGL